MSRSHHGCSGASSLDAFFTAASLSSGNSSARTSLMPTSLAMMLADAALSPVSMDSRLTPRERRRSNDSFALARGISFMTIRAASLPLMDTNVAIS